MFTIKGFTTKEKTKSQILDEINNAGASYKLPFKATLELDCQKNPFSKSQIQVDSFDGKQQKIEEKSFVSNLSTEEESVVEESLNE